MTGSKRFTIDELFAEMGVDRDTVITKPCCDTETTVGARDYTERFCDHGCCLLWNCSFCGAPDGCTGPAACPCGCMDRHEEGPPT